MTDAPLLAELHVAGVAVTAEDDLATIRARLEARLVDIATAESEAFDRPLLDRLVQLRSALEPETDDAGGPAVAGSTRPQVPWPVSATSATTPCSSG